MTTGLQTSYWPADQSSPIWDMTVGDVLRRAAALAGEREALVEVAPDGAPSLTAAASTDRRWTYRQLLDEAEACAHWLLARFAPGEHVCIWAPNVPEWIVVQYGAALAGLVVVTANPALQEAELRHVLKQSRASGLIHVDQFRGYDMAQTAGRMDDVVRERISLTGFMDRLKIVEPVRDLPPVAPDAPVQIQFTSGTTGLPKGALLHHRGMVTNAAFLVDRSGHLNEIWVSPLPLFHTAGSGLCVLGCATRLSTLVLPCLFEPRLMLSAIERERATVVGGVPTMLVALLEALPEGRSDLSSLRVMVSGGSPVPPKLHERVEAAFGCPLTSLFGQTELSPSLTANSPDDSAADRAETSGRPLPQVEVRIVDPQTGELAPIGHDGEVQARGYQLMLGYVGQDDATARTILPDGWLRTGDIGQLDSRGYLRITGRLSDMIIRGGENLYPAEIEAALTRHPAVAEAAVFGLPDDHWGEIAAAAIRLRPQADQTDAADLKSHCRNLLSPQKTPSDWFVVEAMPLTPSGKVQKFTLRDDASAGRLRKIS